MDHLDSKNLVPFKRRRNGYHLPGLTKEAEEQIIDEVDPELRPEEQSYVRHYLGYADVMLKHSEQAGQEEAAGEATPAQEQPKPEVSIERRKVSEIPRRDEEDTSAA